MAYDIENAAGCFDDVKHGIEKTRMSAALLLISTFPSFVQHNFLNKSKWPSLMMPPSLEILNSAVLQNYLLITQGNRSQPSRTHMDTDTSTHALLL